MITSPAWKDKKYAVLGLARSGRATAEALLAAGADVLVWDDRAEARAKRRNSRSVTEAANLGIVRER